MQSTSTGSHDGKISEEWAVDDAIADFQEAKTVDHLHPRPSGLTCPAHDSMPPTEKGE